MRSTDLITQIDFKADCHNGKNVVCCYFPKDTKLIADFKARFPFAKWSNTKRCWYLPDLPAIREQINLPLVSSAERALSGIHPVNQPALLRMKEQLELLSYSPNTHKVYINEFSQFLKALKAHSADQITPDKLRSYLLYCIRALKYYYEQVLGNERLFLDIPRPKKPDKLPKVISVSDIAKLFDATSNLKYKLMLQLCYGLGLRVSEVTGLRIADIDSARMQVTIRQSKGKKDRVVMLPETILPDLRSYYKQYRPKEYLFEGQFGGQYSVRSLQAVFKEAIRRSNLKKNFGIHSLRHSYATHLLEYGTDISFIQRLLGHNDIKTTLIYLNVSNRDMLKIKSPLDNINLK